MSFGPAGGNEPSLEKGTHGGTYFDPPAALDMASAGVGASSKGGSFPPKRSPIPAPSRVSLMGHFEVKWSPLQIRQAIFLAPS